MTGQQIQQKRLQLGLSETQLAEKFGIDLNTLQLWESGLVSPPYPKLLELAFIALEGNWAISDEKEAEFARIRKLIDDGHKRMLETFPSH
ncbi:MAG: helix-turn-helix transcriptional regulator [Blastocatellia bacterium]